MLAHQRLSSGLTASTSSRRSAASRQRVGPVRAVAGHAPTASYGLTKDQVEQFHRDGFLVINNAASKEEIAALRTRAQELVDGFDPQTVSVFSTRNQLNKTDEYFLNSSSNISFFFEEKAFDESGKLVRPKAKSINKIGHAMHDVDPVFRAFSRSQTVAAVLRSLGYKRPTPVQSMFIFKQPFVGGEVVPHQDSSFIYTQPLSCVGLWWALEDCSKTNGCLWALPGVHKQGLARRFLAKDGKVLFDKPAPQYDMSQFVPLECSAGTLVLLQGENVHYSAENNSPISRMAYSMHLTEGDGQHVWPADNWAQRLPSFPWQPLYDEVGQK